MWEDVNKSMGYGPGTPMHLIEHEPSMGIYIYFIDKPPEMEFFEGEIKNAMHVAKKRSQMANVSHVDLVITYKP
jgi:hypothetical protein